MIIDSFASFLNQVDPNAYNEIINKPENKDLALLARFRLEQKNEGGK